MRGCGAVSGASRLWRAGINPIEMVFAKIKAFVGETIHVRRGNAPLAPFLARLTVF